MFTHWRRRYQWSAVTVIMVFVVIFNTGGNMWLLRKPNPLKPHTPPRHETASSHPHDEPLAKLDLHLGRWDSSRAFKMFDYAAVGHLYSKVSASRKVCLATQSSIESLREVLKSAAHWTGPISIAVLVVEDEMKLLHAFTTWMYRCHPEVYSRLALHVATPGDKLAVFGIMPDWARNCSAQPMPPEKESNVTDAWKASHLYPQNLLRNLARKNCHTPYVFMVDVDIVPSKDMAESLDQFFSSPQKCHLCAYVIPTYELDWSVTRFPANKSELLQLVKKNLAVPFHKKVFTYNQFSSNLAKWESSRGIESNMTHVSHNVTKYKLLYEPFYVAPDTVPPHDERFLGYGFTRNSQVYEMFILGYQFKVLSPIFTIHWGLQQKKQPSWRVKQVNKNSRKFNIFKKELHARYGKDPLGMFKKSSKTKPKAKSGKK